MKPNLNLQQFNLEELNAQEVSQINGGAEFPWKEVAFLIAENWTELKKGAISGWNDGASK